MRTFDLAPLYRSTVGFDRLFSLLDQGFDGAAPGYPPYNIEKLSDDAYRVTMAVAGFAESDLEINVKGQTLSVTGNAKKEETAQTYLHRGIAGRSFVRHFQLAEHIRVANAALINGLLHIELVREVPEALKPRTITIGNQLTQQAAAPAIEDKGAKAA